MRLSDSNSAVPSGLGLPYRRPSLERLGYSQISRREMANRTDARFSAEDIKKMSRLQGCVQSTSRSEHGQICVIKPFSREQFQAAVETVLKEA